MGDSRVPKHGDFWFIPRSGDEGPGPVEWEVLWHIIGVFGDAIFVYDEIDWPPPHVPLFQAPTEPIKVARGYSEGGTVPERAVLIWRDKTPMRMDGA